MNFLRRLRGVDDFDAIRISTGEGEEACADAAVELFRFEVEAGLGLALAAFVVGGVGTTMNESRLEVEQDGEVGDVALGGEQGETFDQGGSEAARVALVGDAGVETAVGDDELACLQRGQDECGEVLGAVGLEEKRFGQRRHVVFGMVQQ